MDDRYQNQKWYVKLWRTRHYLRVPGLVVKYYLLSHKHDDPRLSFQTCLRIAQGVAQLKMKHTYTFDEVKEMIKQ